MFASDNTVSTSDHHGEIEADEPSSSNPEESSRDV